MGDNGISRIGRASPRVTPRIPSGVAAATLAPPTIFTAILAVISLSRGGDLAHLEQVPALFAGGVLLEATYGLPWLLASMAIWTTLHKIRKAGPVAATLVGMAAGLSFAAIWSFTLIGLDPLVSTVALATGGISGFLVWAAAYWRARPVVPTGPIYSAALFEANVPHSSHPVARAGTSADRTRPPL